ncbi:zinc finger protein 664-like [Periplaneta americana]|uniref:zinc finger protein 664-like n=1 Tax=Periplaneta americana TaxID=6978 RepID=UPI0037E8623E
MKTWAYHETRRRDRHFSLPCHEMDVIKTEPEEDPLAIEESKDGVDIEEKMPFLEEEDLSLLSSHTVDNKLECADPSYEIKLEGNPVKCEPEEASYILPTVKEEPNQENWKEDHQLLSEGIAVKNDDEVTLEYFDLPREGCANVEKGFPSSKDASDRTVDNQNNARNNVTHSHSSVQCGVCGMSFLCMSDLRRHLSSFHQQRASSHLGELGIDLKLSSEERSFSCDACGDCFSHAGSLRRHGLQHTGEKPFQCQKCGKCFTRTESLRMHEESFKCDSCDKYFTSEKVLKAHERQHAGKEAFKCDACGKCCVDAGHLKCHARKHTGERPYTCEVCGQGFSHSGSLTRHRRMHTGEKPFKCSECGKCFVHAKSLKTHTRKHTGEKPYKCEVCGKCFLHWGSIKTHARIHTGEKPFKCDVCGKCFSHRGSYKIHTRIHTRETIIP